MCSGGTTDPPHDGFLRTAGAPLQLRAYGDQGASQARAHPAGLLTLKLLKKCIKVVVSLIPDSM